MQFTEYLKNNIKDSNKNISSINTVVHGFISTKSFELLELALQKLRRLFTVLQGLEYENTDMHHATNHLKSLVMSQLLCLRKFMTFITYKRVCSWSGHYFTSRKEILYPPSEDVTHFDEEKPYLLPKVIPIAISIEMKKNFNNGQLVKLRQ